MSSIKLFDALLKTDVNDHIVSDDNLATLIDAYFNLSLLGCTFKETTFQPEKFGPVYSGICAYVPSDSFLGTKDGRVLAGDALGEKIIDVFRYINKSIIYRGDINLLIHYTPDKWLSTDFEKTKERTINELKAYLTHWYGLDYDLPQSFYDTSVNSLIRENDLRIML